MTLLPMMILLAQGAVTLANSDFAAGLEGWQVPAAEGVTVEAVRDQEHPAVRVAVADTVPKGWWVVSQSFPVTPGDAALGEADVRPVAVRNGAGAYLTIEYLDTGGKRVSVEQTEIPPAEGLTTRLRVLSVAPEGAVTAKFCLVFNGSGEAFFSKAALSVSPPPPPPVNDGPVTVRVTDQTACASLIGFGAEDDGWFYNAENRAKGVTEEDCRLHDARIAWMEPDWVRMFFWYPDWNPSGDWETLDFETDNMRSHYRALDLYQRLGAHVNVVGVEWGVKDPFGDPAKLAHAIGALMEHLIRDRGYTCVRSWTLTNEPNGHFIHSGYDFARFRDIHLAVRAEFQRRGLDVSVVGSDDTGGFAFFSRCVNDPDYFAAADYFVSHRYLQHSSRRMMSVFLDERLALLRGKTPEKPFVVGEFGFQDKRSGTLENPLMEEYDYALWTASFVIEGLNKGVAGFSVWCLCEMYYPGGGFMNYGLWNFKDDGFRTRPVYHAWAPFSRLTRRGDAVRRCEAAPAGRVTAAHAGDTLFWVNESDVPAEVIIEGASPKTVRIMTEETLEGDRDCGKEIPLENGRFTSPPRSFGYAR